ncbi:MAG: transcriptional repressor NrdR [Deltaproteobacteria bacterium]|nr:transcriptional repressor NrdR [Deltaproteobacteria bacterium]MBW1965964.1 transcriptional repressor NrdR [Deltaproteobacteria bacterium]MBW2097347.1 transcriptional repressor NrdR [Deltaproteobacteria bacterium]PXF55375.1 MAG: transcriptional regulator NrdR [Deltaproteobacteria bacterium]RKX60758.1 MAG: transcriptional regulator NrdR [Thermodesulfobacteriota bacterium]
MKCPFCNSPESKVVDSRSSKDSRAIRRRRECLSCHERFTTYERIEEFQPMVVKKDGRRESFDRNKIVEGIVKACEKRPVSMDEVEAFVSNLEKEIQDSGEREVESRFLGERVMSQLRAWDDVAYVRFASVYKQFKDLNEFMEQLQELLSESSRNQSS